MKKIIENLSVLTILQLLNYALPFVTLPYLVRVLGMEHYGAFLFSQSFILIFLIFVDFGFDLYATRLVSINRNDTNKLKEIFSTVFYWKIIFLTVSFVCLLILTQFISIFNEYQILHLINFLMIVGMTMYANFYFQGTENLRQITIFQALSKVFFTIAIFIFVKDANDLYLTAIINSLGQIFVGIASFWIIYKKYNIKFIQVPYSNMINVLKESSSFFWSRVAVSIYTTSNIFIIGIFLGNTAAGIFGSADKVFRGIISLYAPLNTVFYPYIAHNRNVLLFKKVMKIAITINIFIALLLFVLSDFVISILFGSTFTNSIEILKILSVALIVVMPSILIGYPLLGGMGYTKYVNTSVIVASILHICLLLLLNNKITVNNVAILVLFTESFVLMYRYYYVRKLKLLKF